MLVKNKRSPSLHEKQMRFFTILFGVLLIAVVVAVLWFLNRSPLHAP